jgi:hypothetical protein
MATVKGKPTPKAPKARKGGAPEGVSPRPEAKQHDAGYPLHVGRTDKPSAGEASSKAEPAGGQFAGGYSDSDVTGWHDVSFEAVAPVGPKNGRGAHPDREQVAQSETRGPFPAPLN